MAGVDDFAQQETGTRWKKWEPILRSFEDAWQAGSRPDLEKIWREQGSSAPVLIAELVHLELEYRLKAGEPARVEEYLQRFPTLGNQKSAVARLLAAEFELRRRRQPDLNLAEYRERFPEYEAEFTSIFNTGKESDTGIGRVGAEPASAHALTGTVLGEHEILGELGRGGMGVVYRAYDRKRDTIVALKTLPRMDPSALYRFKQEFRTLADLTHPNLVSLYELKAEGQTWFFTMEYIEGISFLDYLCAAASLAATGSKQNNSVKTTRIQEAPPAPPLLPSRSTADWERLRDAFGQLALGIVALHTSGKLHRDIKPSNVLATREGRVVLVDFGLATELNQAGQHQSLASGVVGTIAYMAPEQALGQPVSAASDWYSFGMILYQALAGSLPARVGRDFHLGARQHDDLRLPEEAIPAVPEDLAKLCHELLRHNPGDRPSGNSVLHQLGRTTQAPTETGPVPRDAGVFVGRQAQLRILRDSLHLVHRGQPVAVHIQGRSGTGKSSLVQHFLDSLGEKHDVVALAGRCYEQESVPYKALDSLVDSLSRHLSRIPLADAQAILPRDVHHLARLFPVLRRVEAVARAPARTGTSADPHEIRRRATAALRELLARLGDRHRLLLFIDDVQWGDQESADMLLDLLRPPDPPVLLLLASFRNEDPTASRFLATYLSMRDSILGSRCHDLALDPLAGDEARELALSLLGDRRQEGLERAEAIARESGGNPFFVYELVQFVSQARGHTPLTSVKLEDVLWQRIEQLPPGARELIEIVAVAGRRLRPQDACQAARIAGADQQRILQALRSGRLVRALREEIDTYHDRVRETILARLEPERLRFLHLRLAETLAQAEGADPEVLAVHFQAAGELERASKCFASAASWAAEALAFEHAARLYRLALELHPPSPEQELVLREGLADALANAGFGVEAAQAYKLAAEKSSGKESLELQRRAALQLVMSGQIDKGREAYRPLLEAAGLRLSTSTPTVLLSYLFLRIWLYLRGTSFQERRVEDIDTNLLSKTDTCWSVATGLAVVDNIRGAEFQTRGLLLALRTGDPSRVARSLLWESAHDNAASGWLRRQAALLFHKGSELAKKLGEPYLLTLDTFVTGANAYLRGEFKTGLRFLDEAQKQFKSECIGMAWEVATADIFALWCLHWMGQTKELGRRFAVSVQDARKRGDLYLGTNIGTWIMALVRLAADEPGRARSELRHTMSQWSQDGYHVQHQNELLAQLQIALYCGKARYAFRYYRLMEPRFRRSLLGRVQLLRVTMNMMGAFTALAYALQSENPAPLLRQAARHGRRLCRERISYTEALGHYVNAAVAFQRGHQTKSRELLEKALAGFEAVDMGLNAAATRRRLGQLLGGAEGQLLIDQADQWMAAQEIRNPQRMTAAWAAGFPD